MRYANLESYDRVLFIGGIYSNYLALEKAFTMARSLKAEAVIVMGDFGGFGPFPDRTLELLRREKIFAIQGNYEEALAGGAEDCGCGYTDPRDNHYAQISYDYTRSCTSAEHVRWMGELPRYIRLSIGGQRTLVCHGSPRQINEFLWQTMTPRPFIEKMLRDFDTDLIICTHTGLHWSRFIEPGRGVVNVGALGRPANDGKTNVWMSLLEWQDYGFRAEFIPIEYDFDRLAREMESEKLPPEFVATIRTGWWTTCLEVLPAKERARGQF